ncbi:MAG: thrombospondin type 3 repeat-containing protein, partial [Myxococcota bacterium]
LAWDHFSFETEKMQRDRLYNAVAIAMSVSAGERGLVKLDCDDESAELPFRVVPDGELHTYAAAIPDDFDCAIDAMTIAPTDAQGAHVEIDSIQFVLATDDEDEPSTADTDGDGFLDAYDNCRFVPNAAQGDGNGDGFGDACEDADRDGMPNGLDNCPLAFNAGRIDTGKAGCEEAAKALSVPTCFTQDDGDGDGIGDACDPDASLDDGCGCALGASPGAPWWFLALGALVCACVVVARYRKPVPRSRLPSSDISSFSPTTPS